MNLIYIVEPEDMLVPEDDSGASESSRYTTNFTVPGRKPGDESGLIAKGVVNNSMESDKASSALGIVAGLLVSPIVSLPLGLLIGAASSRPIISQLLTTETSKLPDHLKEAEALEIEAFLRKHAITIAMAERRGYRFPPGHPLVGHSYKLHPLSELVGSEKGGVYIPQESYDELILEEREAELLRLLVELGATKICISEKSSARNTSKISGSLSGGAHGAGEANINAATSSSSDSINQDVRSFELVGKPWIRGSKLDRARFAWVAFEPSWGALIAAREVGECTKAAVEIKEETTFSSEKRLSLSIKSKLYRGDAKVDYVGTEHSGKVYYISAEFASFKPALAESTSI